MTTPQPKGPAASSPPAPAAARSPRTMTVRHLAAGTAAIPVALTTVMICPHELAVVVATSLAVAGAAVAAELPRLYWISAYLRLVKKGTAVAATVAEVRDLMTGLAEGQGCITDACEVPGHEIENAERAPARCPRAAR